MKIILKKRKNLLEKTQPRKSFKLSSLSVPKVDKKTLRRGRHKLRKILLVLIPLILIGILISGIFATSLIISLNKPLYISPLSALGIQAIRSADDTNPQTLEKLLKEQKISYTKISKAPDETYIITLNDDEEALVTFKKDIHQQISSLQFILSHLTMEGKQFTRLDLRFDKPVIVAK